MQSTVRFCNKCIIILDIRIRYSFDTCKDCTFLVLEVSGTSTGMVLVLYSLEGTVQYE